MNGVSEANCEVLEEPETLEKPVVNQTDSDPYLPLPTRTAPFVLPPIAPSTEEEETLKQPLEP